MSLLFCRNSLVTKLMESLANTHGAGETGYTLTAFPQQAHPVTGIRAFLLLPL